MHLTASDGLLVPFADCSARCWAPSVQGLRFGRDVPWDSCVLVVIGVGGSNDE